MALQFFLKRGDRSPSIRFTLSPTVDLTGATARFLMRDRATGAAVVTASASVVIPATAGIVQYDWQSADVAASGVYDAEFEITYSTGKIETFPNYGYIAVIISGDIA